MTASAEPGFQVLHAAERLSPGLLAFLALATRELAHAGVQQTVLYGPEHAPGDAVSSCFDPRVRLVEVGGTGGGWASASALHRTLREEVRAHRYDAVHLHAARAGFVGRLALGGVSPRPPVYYSPHGLGTLDRERPVARAFSELIERMASGSVCRPVACGRGEARELERLMRCSAELLDAPVDESFFAIPREPDLRPRVVAMGHASPQKAPRMLAELAARFQFADENVDFVWVGAGDPRIEQMLRAAGVEVTGWLPQEAVRAQLARAHVFVQTSRWEGLPLSLLQAMAVGLPCVATNVAGHDDAITHERTGLLADDLSGLALQVKTLLDEPERARHLGEAAQREARERFHPQRLRRSLLALYRLDAIAHEAVAA